MSIGVRGIGIMNSANGDMMSGQPSPYSDESDVQRDARRFQLVLSLTRMEISEMSPAAQTVWERFVRGGWYTDDLIAGIDALLELETKVAQV